MQKTLDRKVRRFFFSEELRVNSEEVRVCGRYCKNWKVENGKLKVSGRENAP